MKGMIILSTRINSEKTQQDIITEVINNANKGLYKTEDLECLISQLSQEKRDLLINILKTAKEGFNV